MPATEQSVDRRATGHDSFLKLAAGELKMAAQYVSIYAYLLEAQLTLDPSVGGMQATLGEVRAQADRVAALMDDAREGAGQAW